MKKQKMIEKILLYMKRKGEIIDKLYKVESLSWTDQIDEFHREMKHFYTEDDARALKKKLSRQTKECLSLCIEKIVDNLTDTGICPFCHFYYRFLCFRCPYKKNHRCCLRDYRSTYQKVYKILGPLCMLDEIETLISKIFK